MIKSYIQLCKSLTIIFSLISLIAWLTFFQLRDNSDPRVHSLKSLGVKNQLFKIHVFNPAILSNLFFIEILAVTKSLKTNFKRHPIIIINIGGLGMHENSCMHFLNKLQQKQFNSDAPIFLLKSKRRGFAPNIDHIVNGHIKQMDQIFNQFLNNGQFEKISILSYEQGAMITLRVLSQFNAFNLQKIDKVVFINLMNPLNYMSHLTSFYYNRQTCKIIAKNQAKLKMFNQLRIILIDTGRDPFTRYQKLKLQPYDFFIQSKNQKDSLDSYHNFQIKNVNFNQTVFINTRFINNIFCSFVKIDYFEIDMFQQILSNFLHYDHHQRMKLTQIYQYFYLNLTKQIQDHKKEKQNYIQYRFCEQISSQEYLNFSSTFIIINKNCTKIVNSSQNPLIGTMLIHGGQGFNIHNQNYDEIQYFQLTLKKKIYLIQNLSNKRTLYIVNKKGLEIIIQKVQTFRPDLNPFPLKQEKHALINICPGNLLLYPQNFQFSFWQDYFFTTQSRSNKSTCYLDINNFDFNYAQVENKQFLIMNFILFTLFCSHITNSPVFSKRLLIQFIVNMTIWIVNDSFGIIFSIMINMIILLCTSLTQLALKALVNIFNFAKVRRKYSSKIVWIPLWVEILRSLISFQEPPYWHVFFICLPFVLTINSTIILFIQMLWIKDYIVNNASNFPTLFLMSLWLNINLPEDSSFSMESSENNQKQTEGQQFKDNLNTKRSKFAFPSQNILYQDKHIGQKIIELILQKFPGLRPISKRIGLQEYLNFSVASIMAMNVSQDSGNNQAVLIKGYIVVSLILHVRKIIK